jgi:Ca2+-binding EF-hand superfamily protein
MISINEDPDLQTLIVPQCGLTCVDLKELERGVKVAHLEKLFPYLEKHIDTSHQYSCQNNENDTENDNKSCKSITRRELKRMVKSLGKDENGVLSMEEFCEFLSKLDDCVQDKCEDPNAVMKVIVLSSAIWV